MKMKDLLFRDSKSFTLEETDKIIRAMQHFIKFSSRLETQMFGEDARDKFLASDFNGWNLFDVFDEIEELHKGEKNDK